MNKEITSERAMCNRAIWIAGIIIMIITIGILSYVKNEVEMNKVITKIEEREVISGEYFNINESDYIVLQVEYEEYSRIEKYPAEKILLFNTLESDEKSYLKEYYNRYDKLIKRELYYPNKLIDERKKE